MPGWRDLQRQFATALLGEDERVVEAIDGDGLAPQARLAIYRHHVLASLTEALGATYPVVRRLVDERFFAYAADRYIRAHPPAGPCLFEYGETFPQFLREFPPCRELPYLADVARLEWALARAVHAEDAPPLSVRALGGVPVDRLADLTMRLHPSVSLVWSPWPVGRIWRAHQPDAGADVTVDLNAGEACLEVRRAAGTVGFRTLAPGAWVFRQALHEGQVLGEAAEAAAATDRSFDLAGALRDMFSDGVLVGFSRHRGEETTPCKPRSLMPSPMPSPRPA
jgi:hypothetical protein